MDGEFLLEGSFLLPWMRGADYEAVADDSVVVGGSDDDDGVDDDGYGDGVDGLVEHLGTSCTENHDYSEAAVPDSLAVAAMSL